MVRGLFPRLEHDAVLATLEKSVFGRPGLGEVMKSGRAGYAATARSWP
jgi:hypothetical protein